MELGKQILKGTFIAVVVYLGLVYYTGAGTLLLDVGTDYVGGVKALQGR